MPLLIRLLIRPSLFAVALCATFVGCSRDTREAPNVAEQAQPAADLILTNGKIFTMDPQRSWAQALAVSDGRIVYVGTEQGVRAYRGDASKLVDLQQKMVLPGFQDVHIHPVSGGVAYTGCALFDLDTLQLVLDKIASCARENPAAAHIIGKGWSWDLFIGQGEPNKQLLDAIDDTRPLVVGDSDGHTLWVNSAALALAEISRDTPDPQGGEVGRAANGELSRRGYRLP